jgi:hypothetical protein
LLKDQHDEWVTGAKIVMGIDGRVVNEPSTIGVAPELAFDLLQKNTVKETVSVTAHSHHDLL